MGGTGVGGVGGTGVGGHVGGHCDGTIQSHTFSLHSQENAGPVLPQQLI